MGAEGDLATLREQVASLRRDFERLEAQQHELEGLKLDVAEYKKLRASLSFLWATLGGAIIAGIVAYGFNAVGG